MVYIPQPKANKSPKTLILIIFSILGLTLSVGIVWGLFVNEIITIGGVPYRVLAKFWQDEVAMDAYFKADGKKLHDRLDQLGIEEAMKAYYRSQIPDEVTLDQHIHQILYDRTGYVGDAYKVDSKGILVLKNPNRSILETPETMIFQKSP